MTWCIVDWLTVVPPLADRQVQQSALAGTVRADQRGHVPGGDRQGALA
jgi:hypothetical protein